MTTHTVSNNTELATAISVAVSGDIIEGTAGADLGDLTTSNNTFTSFVKITSADPNNKASMSGFSFSSCSFIDIDGLDLIHAPGTSGGNDDNVFYMFQSSDMKIQNCTFTGLDHATTGYGSGRAISLRECDRVDVDDNVVSGFARGIKVLQVKFLNIRRNEISRVKYDVMQISQAQNFLIEGNYLHDHRGDPNDSTHRDMIQFQLPNGQVFQTKDGVLRRNLLDIGDGDWSQGFFINSEYASQGVQFTYDNILVEENEVYGRHTHGITLTGCINSTVRKNTLVQAKDNKALALNQNRTANTEKPKINISGSFSSNNAVENSTATDFAFDGSVINGGVNNYQIDPATIDDYDSHFTNIKKTSGTQGSPIANDWAINVGGGLDLSGAGVTDMNAAGNGSTGSGGQPPTLSGDTLVINVNVA